MSRAQTTDPGRLIAAIPTLLGFRSTDSVILFVYTGPAQHPLLGAVLRVDLPNPPDVDDWVAHLCAVVANQQPTKVGLVMLGGDTAADTPDGIGTTRPLGDRSGLDLPGRQLLSRLAVGLAQTAAVIGDVVWAASVDAGTWHCYRDPARSGVIPDPASLPVVAAATAAGMVTYGSREELAAVIAPHPGEVLAHRARLIADLGAVDPQREIRFLTDLVDRLHAGRERDAVLDDATIARLVHALRDGRVRDTALALCVGSCADTAERVWTVLVRGAPGTLVANPAFLLGICAYLRGEGTLAAIAFDRACAADPNHPIAADLRTALHFGLPPAEVRRALEASLATAAAATARTGPVGERPVGVERS